MRVHCRAATLVPAGAERERLNEALPPEAAVLEESARDDWANRVHEGRRNAKMARVFGLIGLGMKKGSEQFEIPGILATVSHSNSYGDSTT